MNYLFVVAHPDDETLGAGATIRHLTKTGHNAYVCCLNIVDSTRYKDNPGGLLDDYSLSLDSIGVTGKYIAIFEDGNFGNEKHREIVEFIEKAIEDCKPDYIFTHFYGDMNEDHRITYQCCKEAARYSHRGIYNAKELRGFYMMEVPSETNWGFDGKFRPNYYIEVDKIDISKKIKALKVYEGVVREEPHPRSEKNIIATAVYRGAECNSKYAEAFEVLYEKR